MHDWNIFKGKFYIQTAVNETTLLFIVLKLTKSIIRMWGLSSNRYME